MFYLRCRKQMQLSRERAKWIIKAADATKKKTDIDKAPKQTHEENRLLITTTGHHTFLIFLLQLSFKLTNKGSVVAKGSMKPTLLSISQQTIDTI
jgi:hypothetical protein